MQKYELQAYVKVLIEAEMFKFDMGCTLQGRGWFKV